MNFLNFFIAKLFLKIKYANMINIINDKEVIPELLQKECNSKEIFKSVIYFLKNPDYAKQQIQVCEKTLDQSRSKSSSGEEAANILSKYLIS